MKGKRSSPAKESGSPLGCIILGSRGGGRPGPPGGSGLLGPHCRQHLPGAALWDAHQAVPCADHLRFTTKARCRGVPPPSPGLPGGHVPLRQVSLSISPKPIAQALLLHPTEGERPWKRVASTLSFLPRPSNALNSHILPYLFIYFLKPLVGAESPPALNHPPGVLTDIPAV